MLDHEQLNIARIRKIKAEMGANDDTTYQLADMLEISRAALSAKLNGKAAFTIRELEKLAQHYNKEYNYFF